MAAIRIRCPRCGMSTKLPAGESWPTRCDRCGTVLPEDGQGGPERQPGRSVPWLVLVALGVGVGALLLAGGVYLVWAARSNNTDTPVTAADLDRIKIFMTRDEVEAVLGKGKEADLDTVHPNWIETGQKCRVTLWQQWKNGDDSLYVGFGQGTSGTHRAVVSFFVENSRGEKSFRQETKIGFINLDPFGSDLDDLARDRAGEDKLLNSPRWLKGPAIRKSLVGSWVAIGVGHYLFKEDGTCEWHSGADRFTGTYRFTDDEHAELTIKAAPLFPGQQTDTKKQTFKVLVDQAELILVDIQLPAAHPIVYQRRE